MAVIQRLQENVPKSSLVSIHICFSVVVNLVNLDELFDFKTEIITISVCLIPNTCFPFIETVKEMNEQRMLKHDGTENEM